MDGEPLEFEWNILPGLTSLQILHQIQNDLQERNIELEKFGDRIIFMSMFNDIEWTAKGNEEFFRTQKKSKNMHQNSRKDIGRSLDLETKRNGTLATTANQQTRRKMRLYGFSDGATIPRSMSLRFFQVPALLVVDS